MNIDIWGFNLQGGTTACDRMYEIFQEQTYMMSRDRLGLEKILTF